MAAKEPIFEVHPVGPLRCNAYLLGCPRTHQGLIIDPGDEADLLLERARALGLNVEALVHTHTHLDHVGATRRVAEAFQAPILFHEKDLPLYRMLPEQRVMFGLPRGDDPRPADRFLEDGEEIQVGDLKLRVIHTPGHTLGSICLQLGDRLFSGDTLFRGSIGRTDLGGTSPAGLVRSIKSRLYPLDDGTLVLPGHGERTTMGEEKGTNPFLR
jgi:glyoxylase-like metal-dependent hydrolase (beta-lactamase superfamily II)